MDPWRGVRRPGGPGSFNWKPVAWFGGGIGVLAVLVAWLLLSDSDTKVRAIKSPVELGANDATIPQPAVLITVPPDAFGGNEPSTATTPQTNTSPTTSAASTVPTTARSILVDPASPAVVARPVPTNPVTTLPPAPPPPWAASTKKTAAGYLSTDLGCAASTNPSALDAFFAERIGPLLGADYQHVYPLGGDRYLWLFQDAFLDHTGQAQQLGQARFAHNIALVQNGSCFSLWHQGTAKAPASFEGGTGETRATWFWPLGGELDNGVLRVFWAEMLKDGYDPSPPDGLGWHPVRTWLASYEVSTLRRLEFRQAPNPGVSPLYGFAVSSDNDFTYLFGNTFQQNLVIEGGFYNMPHSATKIALARVPRGRLTDPPEYWAGDRWSRNAADAEVVVQRFNVENPMQPRYLAGQWVSAAKVDGYWGEELVIDVAEHPWGPWTTVERRPLQPRGGDPKMNTYHAHLMPWFSDNGSLVVTVSQNARNMLRDAFPNPRRYRLAAFGAALVPPPPPPPPTTVPVTTVPQSTTVPTTVAPTTPTTPTTRPPATTTTPTTSAPTTSAPTTVAPTTAAPTTVSPTTAGPATTVAPETTAVPATAPPSASTSPAGTVALP